LAERRAHGGSVGLSSKASVNWPPKIIFCRPSRSEI
jgi:hypothetical protein